MRCVVVQGEGLLRVTEGMQCVLSYPEQAVSLCRVACPRGHAKQGDASNHRCPFYPCDISKCLFRVPACIDPAKEERFAARFTLLVPKIKHKMLE